MFFNTIHFCVDGSSSFKLVVQHYSVASGTIFYSFILWLVVPRLQLHLPIMNGAVINTYSGLSLIWWHQLPWISAHKWIIACLLSCSLFLSLFLTLSLFFISFRKSTLLFFVARSIHISKRCIIVELWGGDFWYSMTVFSAILNLWKMGRSLPCQK